MLMINLIRQASGILGCIKRYFHRKSLVTNPIFNIQDYSRENPDENIVICSPKYKKPLELDILFNSK
jgi:hypothetical protein